MSASLFDLLSRQTPTLQVRKGLIVLDLQNDFLSPEGKLTVRDIGFLEPLSHLVESFREWGDVIWVRSEFESNRPIDGGDDVVAGGSSGRQAGMESSDDAESSRNQPEEPDSATTSLWHDGRGSDEELFLSRTSEHDPCCLRGSYGAQYFSAVLPMIEKEKDLQMIKTHYSAFSSTSLLLTLRTKLITELYICGCITNLSVYATAMDAARYGIRVTLVDDCLGYRRQANHDIAIAQLQDLMEASTMRSTRIIESLGNPVTERIVVGHAMPKHNEMTAMEADSDDSEEGDEEVKPTPSKWFDRRIEHRLVRPTDRFSPRVLAYRKRKATSDHAQSPSTHRVDTVGTDEMSPRSGIHRSRQNISTSELNSASGDGSKLSSHDSSKSQPWLELLSSTPSVPVAQPKHPVLAAMMAAAALSPQSVAEIEEMMHRVEMDDAQPHLSAMNSKPLFGDDKEEESASSRILYDLLPPELSECVFDRMKEEVDWQKMHHLLGEVPRLVCCQGTINPDGSMPIYRHPSDHIIPLQPWTPTVDLVRQAAEKAVGHPLNHVLIQLYRSGTDFISEHSDKTLDISPGSFIVNVSFGAQRTMRLRTKRGAISMTDENDDDDDRHRARVTYRIPTPHNSMIIMSLKTNAQYLHAINADKRPRCELLESEMAFGGQRISCTFRQIGTFISGNGDDGDDEGSGSSMIWGQGAVGKRRNDARRVVNGDVEASERLVRAFGRENAKSGIEWEEIYGEGFDVLHLKAIRGNREGRGEVGKKQG